MTTPEGIRRDSASLQAGHNADKGGDPVEVAAQARGRRTYASGYVGRKTTPRRASIDRDPRWVILAETGDYTTLGRHHDPDESDIAAVEATLAEAGVAGWLVVMSHSIHARTLPELVMVRPLRNPRVPFADAVHAFRGRVG